MPRWPPKQPPSGPSLDTLRPRGNGGYADLLLSYAEFGLDGLNSFAAALGYERDAEIPAPPTPSDSRPTAIPKAPEATETAPEFTASQPAELPLWQPLGYVDLTHAENALSEPEPDPEKPWRGLPDQAPVPRNLASWRDVMPRIRKAFATPQASSAPDLDAIVHDLARGRLLDRIPRRRHRRWGERIQIIVDFSPRLTPFFQDQQRAAKHLSGLFPAHAIEYVSFSPDDEEFRIVSHRQPPRPYRLPSAGSLAVVLGDLGCLDTLPETAAQHWVDLGRGLQRAGCRAVALTPCPSPRWQTDLLRDWTMVPWVARSAASHTAEQREGRATRLLRLASLAIRIEPGLLRDLRLLLGADADAATESDVWQRSEMIGRHSTAGDLDPIAAKRMREECAERESLELRVRAAIAVCRWRGGEMAPGIDFDSIWVEEFDSFDTELKSNLPPEIADGGAVAAYRVWRKYFDTLDQYAFGRSWIRDMFARAPDRFLTQGGLATQAIKQNLFLKAHEGSSSPPALPKGYRPGLGRPRAPERLLALRLAGADITATLASTVGAPGSLLTWLRAGDEILVRPLDPLWATGEEPSWAHDWGTDAYGPWVTFRVPERGGGWVEQRMRWCRPGRFMMGSPEDEDGRSDDERPQHAVTFAQGFWMFDTACTEQLWTAVLNRPTESRKTGRFPVTHVSWQDAQDFIAPLNAMLPGLALSLPSEAQWEYACRAGSTTAYSFGDTIQNSQVNFGTGGRVLAGSLPANAWGLHEMHGNVWEWCADHWHDTYNGAPVDGSPWIDDKQAAAARVLRGGSWNGGARSGRSAYRNAGAPAGRGGGIGFRCARVQAASGAEQVAVPADPASRPGAERGRPQGATRAATLLRVGEATSCPAPRSGALLIRSDREELRFRRFEKPAWASAIGRDRFGLFSEFTVPGTEVSQRMRWVPPGQFDMGWLDDEPGRYDAEGPVHRVTIAEGFWLFDTPCTQALWQAVMPDNPSHFQSPTRPVEQVSYEDVLRFLTEMNDRLPGLALSLPSEAQWEYACRAGTQTSTYAGPVEILGARNAPILDAIAWYGGNSGQDFDLASGVDSAGWPEKQYDHSQAGSRPVALKAPNPWGLYDMLGNVWEWCADEWHATYDGAPNGGSAWIDDNKAAADRVLRGGSWRGVARIVRSAYRVADVPASRDVGIGFRCARVQSASVATAAAQGGEEQAQRAEREAATTSPKRAGATRVP